ncbi:hydrogenase expression/formation protein [Solidesulfovibrio carbinoliphilus subsp. oakridgensis]|uniref:Hydrogenase expression/formation protein n=1 Tax=Solidesulfovibrio carbinoliphilus subsp. oakridgensis TaxID=694327 RepID=G7Q4Q9_9BACT|nr:HyaD/HybD family hydrogenase maturation endopeptidase [Solidesulfovibrio carbinoliphilus]EHJ47519.1 hydrogenase expression/formation protein [Solidesulfovibrio carbinoliphilus subsp. oakridgensis]
MTEAPKKILILGVGNILYTDEGVGVRAVERLLETYEFSDNVTLMDGGNLGMRLMQPLMDADYCIVLDAVLGGDAPGTIYRLTGEDLRKSLAFKDSMHQSDLVDTLIYCELIGKRPDTVVIGMEPFDFKNMAVELSPTIDERLPAMCDIALKELADAGGVATPKA